MSTTQKSSHDNFVEFSQEITSDPSFNLSCSSFQSNIHVNGDCDLQQHGIPKRKIRKLSRISLPKKKSKSVQVDLPKGHKNVQVNLSCKTINFSCQTNVPTSNKSSQSISSQQSHCSVQTEKSEEYLDHGEHKISISDFLEMLLGHLKTEKQCDDFIKLAYSLMIHQIPSDNMAWLAALHLGHYSRCKTTCNMKYNVKYAEFFSLLYLLFGS